MKVFVQIIDTKSGISQNGMIEESVQKGFEVANAIGHFGVNINNVDWLFQEDISTSKTKVGNIIGTTKLINVTII